MSLLNLVVVALAIGLVFNLLLTFALIHRLRRLQRGIRLVEKDVLPVGYEVGTFSAATPSGGVVTEATLADALVGFFVPDCKACDQVHATLATTKLPGPLTSLVVGHLEDPRVHEVAAKLRAFGPVAYAEPDDAAIRAFRATAFPVLYRVQHGIVRAAGNDLEDVLA